MDLCGPANSYLVPVQFIPSRPILGVMTARNVVNIAPTPACKIDSVNAEACITCITLEGGDVLSPKH